MVQHELCKPAQLYHLQQYCSSSCQAESWLLLIWCQRRQILILWSRIYKYRVTESETFRPILLFVEYWRVSTMIHVVGKFCRTVQVLWTAYPHVRAAESSLCPQRRWPAPAANPSKPLWYAGAEGTRRETGGRGDSRSGISQIYTEKEKAWVALLSNEGTEGIIAALISNNAAAVHIAVVTPAQNTGLQQRFLQIYSFHNENTTENTWVQVIISVKCRFCPGSFSRSLHARRRKLKHVEHWI